MLFAWPIVNYSLWIHWLTLLLYGWRSYWRDGVGRVMTTTLHVRQNTAASVLTVGMVTVLPVSPPDSTHPPSYLLTTPLNDWINTSDWQQLNVEQLQRPFCSFLERIGQMSVQSPLKLFAVWVTGHKTELGWVLFLGILHTFFRATCTHSHSCLTNTLKALKQVIN